ncbi:MAG TPA: leishmanolysin-related zinc metalloendopeptidase [Anaeromyxobacter sp.]|nr:leishmanolysin-related zinc metalloendopeptidase [Anaeromyxobacter sp.]
MRSLRSTFAAALSLAVAGCQDGGGGRSPSLGFASASRQTGRPGEVVGSPPAVLVLDAFGRPMSGVGVDFEVTAGDGTAAPGAVTGPDGVARGSWQLGPVGEQALRATSVSAAGELVFSADLRPTTGYEIDLRLLTTASDSQWRAFLSAADRIGQVVVSGLSPVDTTGQSCEDLEVGGEVTSLLILVKIHSIDGPGGVLGQAGPCIVRFQSQLPVVGLMELDSADLDRLESTGRLESVILHEMLHVVGFGTMWADASPSLISGAGTADSAFTGANALSAAKASNGAPAGWTTVPLENCGLASPSPCGEATRDSHWLEPVYQNELMTGWISGITQPLSATTVGSLKDLGYDVSFSAADAFTLPSPTGLRTFEMAPAGVEYLGDDVLRLPVKRIPERATSRPR